MTTTEKKEQLRLFREQRKQERKRIRDEKKETARINREKNQPPVKKITITIEWKKSRTWGNCPRLTAEIQYHNGKYGEFTSYASVCGYDKESQVIADVFNHCLKYKLYFLKDSNNFPYGIGLGQWRHFAGGIGTNCYYEIAEAINGTFAHVAGGKTFDVYTYTDRDEISN